MVAPAVLQPTIAGNLRTTRVQEVFPMSGTTTITAQIQIPTDSYVGTSGLHTMMPPGGLANISLPMMTAGEIAVGGPVAGPGDVGPDCGDCDVEPGLCRGIFRSHGDGHRSPELKYRHGAGMCWHFLCRMPGC